MKNPSCKRIVVAFLFLITLSLKINAQQLLPSVFAKPSDNQFKPLTWWHWINGNVTKNGILKDLVDMKDKGIAGVQMLDVHMYMPPGKFKYATEEWYDHVLYAMHVCDSLGLEFYIANSSGWSGSGGTWVSLEKSMKKLVFSEVNMPANSTEIKLNQPDSYKGFYKDVAVLAIRSGIKSEKSAELLKRNALAKMPLLPNEIPGEDTANALQEKDIIDVTSYFNADDNLLKWNAGNTGWVILRFGYTSTGAHVHPAIEGGTGYAVDKLDTAAVAFQYHQTMGKLVKKANRYVDKSFKGILYDSFEEGFQNWTDDMPAQFHRLKGYDLKKYLPVLAGRKVGSERLSYAFLWDFHDAITRLLATNYYGTMQHLAHQDNLKIFVEGYGKPMSPPFVNAFADVPMNEFWTMPGYSKVQRAHNLRQTVSSANVQNKNIVAAEAFTATPKSGKWQSTPGTLKPIGDFAFAYGVNKFVFHTYAHQPFDVPPGFTMGRYGTHFGRTNSWWPYAGAWIDYLSRSQYLLQQGRIVSDVCLLYPRDVVYESAPGTPKIPEGYNHDIWYPDYLLNAKWQNGKLTLPTGVSYKLLVLPEYDYMTLSTLKEIYRLLLEGCIVSGRPPKAIPDLKGVITGQKEFDTLVQKIWGNLDGKNNTVAQIGKGLIYWGKPIQEVLRQHKVEQDIKFAGVRDKNALHYLHRKTDNADIYFISNQTDKDIAFDAVFRIQGKQPEFWDPVSGNIQVADNYTASAGSIKLLVTMAPSGSVFVVFRNPLPADQSKGKAGQSKAEPVILSVNGKWTVEFLDERGAPEKITMPELISWHLNADTNIRYYSGRAAYTNSIILSKEQIKQNKLFKLDLGDIADIGEVFINGKQVGIVWTKPYEADISAFIKAGKNEIKVVIANRWVNRLIGDENIPSENEYETSGATYTTGRILKWPEWMSAPTLKPQNSKRYTFTTWKHYNAGEPLVPSGLLGPVIIKCF